MITSGCVGRSDLGESLGNGSGAGVGSAGRDQGRAFRRLAEVGGLELMWGETDQACLPAHSFDEFVIVVLEQGRRRCRFGRESLVLEVGMVLVIEPGVAYACEAGGPDAVRWRSLLVPPGTMAGWGSHSAQPSPGWHVVHDAGLWARLVRVHAGLMGEPAPGGGLVLEARAMLGEVMSRSRGAICGAPAPIEPRRIRQIREHLAAHLTSATSLDQLSDLVGVSPFYLQRTFKAVTRMSPREYLMDLRIRRARQLLREGVAPRSVGTSVGFFDQSHFTRAFRRLTGVTPGQYAASPRRSDAAAGRPRVDAA